MSLRTHPGWLAPVAVLAAAAGALAQDAAPPRRTLSQLNAQEQDLAQRIGRNRAELARILGALQLFGRDPPPALLADPREVKDAVRAAILMRALAPDLAARARVLSAEATRLAIVRRKAAAANGCAFAAESAQADRLSRLEGVMSDAEALSPPSLRGATAAESSLAPASLSAPVVGAPTVKFGGRLADGASSRGWAWRAGPGAAVTSPAAAVVDYAGPLNGWGLVLILRAGGGCHMVLTGLGKISVSAGQPVIAGQALGAMADTTAGGAPAARELYFEVRLNGEPVDPARLMATPRKTASADHSKG